ncbi:uncharacterized protein At1g24485 [Prunus persica]|uniref:uncharacterized protein At1g24485 n=1 Tax=Prunus persica TaxID=3760 RepID=UPI0009AB355D|nr:uncharacterized protein At1g24485 [Prunus persica]
MMKMMTATASSNGSKVVSIDCGSSDSYTDENSIKWVGDDDFVQNGESQVVQTTNGVSNVMGTLRVFSTRKKNCYSIKAEKGSQFLVRASFYYGNYDKKSAPPSFDLQLDGNYWNTIQTSAEGVVYYEVIYITKGDSIELCLAQTQPNQLPFISAIEIRGLASDMYNHVDSEYAMLLTRRVAYGATEAIRYPSDDFDRIWDAVEVGNGLVKVTTDAQTIDTSVPDQPPVAAFQYGITTSKTSEAILLVTDLPPVEVPIYIIMYFSEVTELDSTQTRSFEIYIDGKSHFDPIVPAYGSVVEMSITNISASSNTSFSLVATSDSTLPPLINAMEVYYVSGPITDGTDSKDVAGLATLQDKFSTLQEWTGDPCLPSPFTWDWVNCSADDTPRVTALYLSGFGLSGQLPEFSSLDALQTIDLHNNSLSGSIPDFLGTLPNLKQLNLADNKLSGPIPTTISNNNKLKLVSSGNPNLCASGGSCKTVVDNSGGPSSGSSSKKKNSKLPLILGIAIPAFFVFWVIVVIFVCSMSQSKRRRAAAIAATNAGQNGGANMPNGLPPQGAPMNPQMMGKFGEVMMNQFAGNDEDQGTPEQGTPEQIRNQQVEERPLQY